MTQCAWAALVEVKETNRVGYFHFRFSSWASEKDATKAIQQRYNLIYDVLDVTTNPYKYKDKYNLI